MAISCNERRKYEMEKAKCTALLAVSLILANLMVASISSVQAQEEFPRDQTLAIGGDASYCGLGFNPYAPTKNRLMSLTYLSLFWYSYYTGNLEPWLAESYEWSSDGSTFIVHLQPTARWRDGTPVTAEDVVFCFETLNVLDPTVIDSITAADEETVHFNVVAGKERNLMVLSNLHTTPIFSKARWEPLLAEYGDKIATYMNEDIDQIEGSGMYTPCLIEPSRNVFERVDDWWGNEIYGQPAPKYVMVLEFAGAGAQQEAFDEGSLDWSDGFISGSYSYVMTHDDVECWNKMDPEGKIFTTAGPIFMVPNIGSKEHPELGQPWLRQAVAYAINLDRITLVCQEGLVPPASASYIKPGGLVGETYIDHDLIEETYGAREIPYDPQKAIEILQEHCDGSVEEGWTWNGTPVGPWKINTVTDWVDVNLMTEMICGDLEDIGIVAEPNIVVWDLHVDRLLTQNFDWIDFTWAAGFPCIGPAYPVSAYKALFTGTPGLASNWCGYGASPNSERVSELIQEMWTVPIGSSESIAAAKEIQSLVVPELPYIPLYTQITWSRYHTTYWVGWPSVDNPSPGTTCTWADQHIPQIIMGVEPAVPPDFALSLTPASASVTAGQSASVTVSITGSGGFAESVSLSASGLPSLATADFDPSSGAPTLTSTLTVSTTETTPDGTNTITITATGGGKTHTSTFSLTVTEVPAPEIPWIWIAAVIGEAVVIVAVVVIAMTRRGK